MLSDRGREPEENMSGPSSLWRTCLHREPHSKHGEGEAARDVGHFEPGQNNNNAGDGQCDTCMRV